MKTLRLSGRKESKMPRRHLLKDIFHMNYKDLEDIYVKVRTIEGLSKHFGVSERTIKNWMKEGNIKGQRHATRARPLASMDAMRRWIHDNPEVKLPRSPQKIHELTKIPLPSVKSFFVRRRRRLTKWLERFPKLQTLGQMTFKSTDGSYVPVQSIDTYMFKVDPYLLRILVYGKRKTGSYFAIPFSPKSFESVFTEKKATSAATLDLDGQDLR